MEEFVFSIDKIFVDHLIGWSVQTYQRKINLPFAECICLVLRAGSKSNEFATARIFALVNKVFTIGAPTTRIIDTTFNRSCRRGCNNRVSKNVYCLQLDSFSRTSRGIPYYTRCIPTSECQIESSHIFNMGT